MVRYLGEAVYAMSRDVKGISALVRYLASKPGLESISVVRMEQAIRIERWFMGEPDDGEFEKFLTILTTAMPTPMFRVSTNTRVLDNPEIVAFLERLEQEYGPSK